jgi:cob(I)alamin adenosyltransferase
MKIYTKTGDSGETSLFGGGRVQKSNPRVAAYGEVDELNSFVGTYCSRNLGDKSGTPHYAATVEIQDICSQATQNRLFDLGAQNSRSATKNFSAKLARRISRRPISQRSKQLSTACRRT